METTTEGKGRSEGRGKGVGEVYGDCRGKDAAGKGFWGGQGKAVCWTWCGSHDEDEGDGSRLWHWMNDTRGGGLSSRHDW